MTALDASSFADSSVTPRPHLEVLLISPVRSLDPPIGDVTYTEQLVASPPPGVRYTTYDVALADGRIIERYRRASKLGYSPSYVAAFAREIAVNRARGFNLLFREGFRHFEVADGAFDLIHAHVFATAIYGTRIPLVVSNAISISDLYRDAFGRSARRVAIQAALDRLLARLTNVVHASFPSDAAGAVVVFSEVFKRELVGRGLPEQRISVIPPAVAIPSHAVAARDGPVRLGFIGNWHSKGGPAVLAAHRQLRETGNDCELVVVGSEPRLPEQESRALGIHWLPRQDRETLLAEVIPTFSVFVYPSRFDGLPLTLLEVMAAGVPVVVSDYKALPEVVDHGRAGKVAPVLHPERLVGEISSLFDIEARNHFGAAARDRVRSRYSTAVTAPALGRVYRSAISGWPTG